MSTTTMSMPFFTIDTLQFSKRMQKAGLQKEIAEELAEAIQETHSQSVDGLATKDDINLLKKDIQLVKQDVQFVEQKLEQKIESSAQKLIIKLGSFIIFSAIAVAGFLAWFLPLAIATKLPH